MESETMLSRANKKKAIYRLKRKAKALVDKVGVTSDKPVTQILDHRKKMGTKAERDAITTQLPKFALDNIDEKSLEELQDLLNVVGSVSHRDAIIQQLPTKIRDEVAKKPISELRTLLKTYGNAKKREKYTKDMTTEQLIASESYTLEELRAYYAKKKQVDLQDDTTQDMVLKTADQIWKLVKEFAKNSDSSVRDMSPDDKKAYFETHNIKDIKYFMEWSDKAKQEYFRTTLGFDTFMNEFPIVSRYMIVMGQYSAKAFKRMLDRVRKVKHPPPQEREKGYMEDQWIRRQADYVRFLWEAYQKKHFNNAEAKWVWEDTYKKLKGEFDDFRNKYKQIEEETKKEKERYNAENAKDLLHRLSTGVQSLEQKETDRLIELLSQKVHKKHVVKVMKELTQCVTLIEAAKNCQSVGTGPEDPDVISKDKPTIRMIEHVDAERINEIPKEYIMSDKELAELRQLSDDNVDTLYNMKSATDCLSNKVE